MEMPLPEALADDRHRTLARSVLLLLGPEEPAGHRPNAEHVEEIPGHELGPDAFRLGSVSETQSAVLNCDCAGNRSRCVAIIPEIRIRNLDVFTGPGRREGLHCEETPDVRDAG